MISLIRYPGSKAKLSGEILGHFPWGLRSELGAATRPVEYREPFFGAGAVGFNVFKFIDRNTPVWINDADPAMVALWSTVRKSPADLMAKVEAFVPTADAFYKFKDEDGRADLPAAESALRKLALHRMSFSGMGAMAGGPIGGRFQENEKYTVDCRWNAQHIKQEVAKSHRLMRSLVNLRITCGDFAPLVDGAPAGCFIYLDPPYYEKGPELYKHSMTDADHVRLASSLSASRCRWLLSYDDHPRVRELYDGCEFRDLHVTYTTARSRADERPKNREVVILPRASSGVVAA